MGLFSRFTKYESANSAVIDSDTIALSSITKLKAQSNRKFRLIMAASGVVSAGLAPLCFGMAWGNNPGFYVTAMYVTAIYGVPTTLIGVPNVFIRKKYLIGSPYKWS